MKNKYYKVNLENPIKCKKDDIFGYSYETSRIKNAIDNNANMIGIISEYGSGKSSLIELLKKKLIPLKILGLKYKVININLWDKKISESKVEYDQNGKRIEIRTEPNDNAIVSLHKSFLRQISLQVSKYNPNYINRRINANYGAAKISFPSLKSLISWFVLYSLLFAIGLYFILKYGYDINSFSKITLEMKSNFVSFLISNAPFILSGFLLFYIIFNREVLFSFWKNSIKREITEEDTIQLYNELFEKKIPFLPRFRKIVIVIEDLDRIENKDIVNFYLNEFYRLYVEGNCKNKDGITLIFCLKDYNDKESIDLYNKIFDYITHINQINYDDKERVLKKIIDKDHLMRDIIVNHDVSEMLWLVEDDNINIRVIKRRLEYFKDIYLMILNHNNEEMSLINRIKSFFSNKKDNIYINITTCAFVAYLRSIYNLELKCIISLYNSDHMNFIDLCIREKILGNPVSYEDIIAKFKDKFKNTLSYDELIKKIKEGYNNPIEFDNNVEFVERKIIELLNNNKFDTDYKKYFYNFPIGTKINSVNENYIYDFIKNDKKVDCNNITTVNESFSIVDYSFIKNKINMVVSLGKNIPNVCLYEKRSLEAAKEIELDSFNDQLRSWFYIDVNSADELCEKLKIYQHSNIDKKTIADNISNIIYDYISEHESVDVLKVRKTLIEVFGKNIKMFDNLYSSVELDSSEIENIEDVDTLISINSISNHSEETENILTERYNSFTSVTFVNNLNYIKCLTNIKVKYGVICYPSNESEKKQIYEEIVKDKITTNSKLLWALKLDYNNKELLDSFVGEDDLNLIKLTNYINKFDELTNKALGYIENSNKLLDLKDSLIAQLDPNSGISLAYHIYKNKKLPINYNEKYIPDLFLKYDEVTEYIKTKDVLSILMKNHTYRKFDSSNVSKEKVLFFSQETQTKELLKSILENNSISLDIKKEYILAIRDINKNASEYLLSCKNVELLIAIRNNSKAIYSNYYKRADKRKISMKINRLINENQDN